MCKTHLKHFHVNCVENILKKREITNHMQNKQKLFFNPSQRYQDSRNFLQNPKVPKNNIGFNHRAQSFTTPYYLDVDSPIKERVQLALNLKKECIKPPLLDQIGYKHIGAISVTA